MPEISKSHLLLHIAKLVQILWNMRDNYFYQAFGNICIERKLNNTITTNDLSPFFIGKIAEKNEPKTHSSRKIAFEIKKEDLKSKNNYLVLSEQFAIFKGWRAEFNGKEVPILKANGIISAVRLEEEGLLEIYYMPESFAKGAVISSASFILFVSFILFCNYTKKRSKKAEEIQKKISEDGKIQN